MPRDRIPVPPPLRRPKRRRRLFAALEPITQAIVQHHSAANAATVEARAEQGRLLLEARKTVPEGAPGPRRHPRGDRG